MSTDKKADVQAVFKKVMHIYLDQGYKLIISKDLI